MRRLLFVIFLVGCGASSKQVRGPDGSDNWYAVTCKRSHANCVEEAGEVCPNGYDVAQNTGHDGMYAQANNGNAIALPTYRGDMLIRCK